MKFLITRLSSPGDVLLTTPVIRCLRNKFPHDTIDFLTQKDFGFVLASNPYLDEIIFLGLDENAFTQQIATCNYDHIIDFHQEFFTPPIRQHFKHTKFHVVKELNIMARLFHSLKNRGEDHEYTLGRYMNALENLGVVNDGSGLDYIIPVPDQLQPDDIPFSHSQGYITISVGASQNNYESPVGKLKELVSQIEYPIILLGEKKDKETGKQIASIDEIKIFNACGKFSKNETADIIKGATLVITHNSFHRMLATAFKKNILSLCFANSAFEKCPPGYFKCFKNKDITRLIAKVHSFVKK